tara:strand:- start:46 stop:387 length:342 start_codon:yes stop_codon:yes gene_type:complete
MYNLNNDKRNYQMTIEVNSARTIKLTYSGYDKYIATWRGEDKNTIRKTIHADSSYRFDKAGLEAAQLFTQWLKDTTPMGGLRDCIITSITMGEISADKRVVLVRTDWIESDEL